MHITGRRNDGYHELQTAFQFLSLCDQVEITPRPDTASAELVELVAPDCDFPVQQNLAYKAARALLEWSEASTTTSSDAALFAVRVQLTKVIPTGAGLGGGSSNAATVLVLLNALWQLDLSCEQLCQIGVGLGADVPVFVHGQACWAEGVGEQMQSLGLPSSWMLLVDPRIAVATASVFNAPALRRDCVEIRIADLVPPAAAREDDCGIAVSANHPQLRCFDTLENVCEAVVRSEHPMIDSLFNELAIMHQHGLISSAPRMTGTGSCIFMRCETRQQAKDAAATLAGWQGGTMRSFVVLSSSFSPLYYPTDES